MSGDSHRKVSQQSRLAFAIIGVIVVVLLWGGVSFFGDLQRSQPPDCDSLKPVGEVQVIIDGHQSERLQIESVANGIQFELATDVCPGKGFIRIFYGTEAQRRRITDITGDDFFGVPYTLHNI